MVTAAIKINGVLGSRSDLSLGSITLSNSDDTGVSTWLWELVSTPPDSSATLSSISASSPTFTIDLVGSYLIQLTVNNSVIDRTIAAVVTTYLGMRIPATREALEFDEDWNITGWSAAMYQAFTAIDGDGYVRLPLASGNPDTSLADGYLYSKDDSGDVELFYLDAAGNAVKITQDGYVNAMTIGNTLDQAYDQGGAGVGRTITADSGAVQINAPNDQALDIDGYISLNETSDPGVLGNIGSIYAKDDSGDTELYYLDNSGNSVQITKDGYVNAAGSGATVFTALFDVPSSYSGMSGYYVRVNSGETALEFVQDNFLDGYLKLSETSGDPVAASNDGYLYTKDDSGDTELYYLDDSGNVVQITKDGLVNITIHTDNTNNPHATDIGNLGSGTLAELNSIVTDATLIDSTLLDSYALESALTSHTSDTNNPHATDIGNLGSGTLAELNAIVTDARLIDSTLLDSYATPDVVDGYALTSALDTHTGDINNPHITTLDKAYDGFGPGLGRTITADTGAVAINASGDQALDLDGYISLSEIIDPGALDNTGSVYAKDDSGDTELYYLDNSGNAVQITKDGYVNAAGSGATVFTALTDTPSSYSGMSGYYVRVNSGEDALEFIQDNFLDGYLKLSETDGDPTISANDGYVYTKDDGGDTELYYFDAAGNAVQITKDGAVNASGAGNTLDQAYDQGGAGAGRTITADSGAVQINASGAHALGIDGYMSLTETTDPSALVNIGMVYAKDDGYERTELFYMDNYGNPVQISTEGFLVGYNISTSDTGEPSGFPNVTSTDMSFVNGSREFIIAPTSSSFYYFNQGRKIVKNSSESVILDNTNGAWYIYYDSTNTLTANQSAWSLKTDVPVAIVYWSVLDSYGAIGEERHGVIMSNATHEYLHDTMGARFISGLDLTGYTIDTVTDDAVQVGVSNGQYADEDLEHTIADGYTENYFEQPLIKPAQIPIYHRVGVDGVWRRDSPNNYIVKNFSGGDDLVAFNEFTGGAWQQTELGSLNYTAYWIVASNIIAEPIICVQGQSEDTTLSNAQENQKWENLNFGTVVYQELKVLFRVIIQTRILYGNTTKSRIRDVVDMRNVQTPSQGNYIATSHGALSDLTTSGHPASIISTDTSSFDGILDANDTNVQSALNTLDNFINSPIPIIPQGADPTLNDPDGYLYSKDVSDYTELFYMDNYGNAIQLTDQGSIIGGVGNTLDQAYDQGGSGVGRTIVADSGSVQINASGDQALDIDGYISLSEITDPDALGNTGSVYTKEIDGYTELFYFDDLGNAVQITTKGAVSGGGGGGSSTFVGLTDTPSSYSGKYGYYTRVNIGEDELEFVQDNFLDGYLKIPEAEGDPVAVLNDGYLYTKDDSGDTELFYLDDSGNVVQITKDGLVDITVHTSNTNNPHSTDIGNLGSGTLAELNAAVTDATLIDSSLLDSYATPDVVDGYALESDLTSHTGDTANPHSTDIGNLGSGTLAELNTIVIDATLIDSSLLDSYATPDVVDGYALTSALTSHTSDTANPHSTDIGNLDSGTLAELNTAITDATLIDSTLLDSYATPDVVDGYALTSALTSHTSDTANPHVTTLDKSYDGSGSGAGRSIIADSGAVVIDASGDKALDIDGYVSLLETTNPDALDNTGSIYAKDDSGDTELCYLDNSGNSVQITKDGYVNAVGSGATVFTALNDVPSSYTGKSGYYTKVSSGEDALEFIAPSEVQGNSLNFRDDFDNDSIDSRWTIDITTVGSVVEQNGRLEVGHTGGTTLDWNGGVNFNAPGIYLDLFPYDFTAKIHISNVGSSSLVGGMLTLFESSDKSKFLRIDHRYGGSLTVNTLFNSANEINTAASDGMWIAVARRGGDITVYYDTSAVGSEPDIDDMTYWRTIDSPIDYLPNRIGLHTLIAAGNPAATIYFNHFSVIYYPLSVSVTDPLLDGYYLRLPETDTDPTATLSDGYLYTKDDGGDTELYYLDNSGNVVQMTLDGYVNTSGASTFVDLTDTPASYSNKYGYYPRVNVGEDALEFIQDNFLDGYLKIPETTGDPVAVLNDGYLYTKDDSGDTELYYLDDSGNVVQITKDGLVDITVHTSNTNNPHATDIGNLGSGTLTELNSIVSDATLIDSSLLDSYATPDVVDGYALTSALTSHTSDTANPHSTDIGNLGSGTLVELNSIITDATLIDSSLLDSYATTSIVDGYALESDLTSHTGDTANPHATDVGNLGSGTLVELNSVITDATLIDSSLLDSYATVSIVDGYALESDLTSHTGNTANPHSTDIGNLGSGTLAELNSIVTDATLIDSSLLDSYAIAGVVDGYLKFPEVSGDPVAVLNDGYLYTKDDGGDTELYYLDDSGNAVQITKDGLVNITVHTDDTNNPHATDIGNLGSGTLAELNSIVTDATLIDSSLLDSYATTSIVDGYALESDLTSHTGDTANPHATDIDNLGSGTLAELNSIVSDATLIDSSLLDSYATPDVVDGYALESDLTSHTGNTANPHSTDIGNLGSGTLSELNSIVSDATLVDSSLLDSYATPDVVDGYALTSALTSHTSNTANPHITTLDQAYDGAGSGAGRTVTADSGPMHIDASGGGALELDGYVSLIETTNPEALSNTGSIYTKDDGYGNTELFYLDDSGNVVQLTSGGTTATGDAYDDDLDSTGTETSIVLTASAKIAVNKTAGYDLDVYRNGVLMKYVAALGIDKMQWTYDSGTKTVSFVASGASDWYNVIYKA